MRTFFVIISWLSSFMFCLFMFVDVKTDAVIALIWMFYAEWQIDRIDAAARPGRTQ